MVLGMPFRRAPVATCDLIQAVLGSALPEDTVLAEQAQRLKMAVALATSKPSGKEFALKCKELLKADSVGIFAVAHSASQLRNCAPLALLATSEPEYAIGADSGVSQLRTEALIHCAARAHIMDDPAADPLAAFRRVNTEGTLALARQAAPHRPPPRR